jgi:hypothetical protein
MKNVIKVIAILCLSAITAESFSQIDVLPNGNVGVGDANPNYKLSVSGNVRMGATLWNGWTNVYFDWIAPYGMPTMFPQTDGNLMIGTSTNRAYMNAVQVWSTWFTSTSDERVKENIVTLQKSQQKLNLLRGIHYDIRKDFISDKALGSKQYLRKNNIGLLAQDVQKVFPELVTKSDSDGIFGINYNGFIPIIIEAIKEQTKTTDSLRKQIADLKSCCKGNSKVKDDVILDSESIHSLLQLSINTARLDQNAPNPYTESTIIKVDIPLSIQNAMLCIYDLTGRQLKCKIITDRGNTAVQIFGYELSPGLYHYALIVDGNLIDTKTMILTE